MAASRRIVSLCPSITETLVGIGALSSLVGATRYCVRPRGMLWGLPRVGGTKNPDIARILDLKPDLVFANEEENRKEDVEALRAHGIEVNITLLRKVADVAPSVRQWGSLLSDECARQAQALAGRIEADLDRLRSAPAPPPFFYAYWIWKDPWMTVSDDTYVADLLRLAGGVNAFGNETVRYPTVSPNEALARGADVLFFPSEPYPFRVDRHRDLTTALFGSERVQLFVNGDDFCWHGARTVDGLKAMGLLRIELEKSR